MDPTASIGVGGPSGRHPRWGDLSRRPQAPEHRVAAAPCGYGWSEPIDIRAAVTARRKQAIAEVVYVGRRGVEPAAAWVQEGWPQRWLDAMNAHPHSSGSPDHPADDL